MKPLVRSLGGIFKFYIDSFMRVSSVTNISMNVDIISILTLSPQAHHLSGHLSTTEIPPVSTLNTPSLHQVRYTLRKKIVVKTGVLHWKASRIFRHLPHSKRIEYSVFQKLLFVSESSLQKDEETLLIQLSAELIGAEAEQWNKKNWQHTVPFIHHCIGRFNNASKEPGFF